MARQWTLLSKTGSKPDNIPVTGRSVAWPACLSGVFRLLGDKLYVNKINFNISGIYLQFVELKSVIDKIIDLNLFEIS